jgi:hypothetical protein
MRADARPGALLNASGLVGPPPEEPPKGVADGRFRVRCSEMVNAFSALDGRWIVTRAGSGSCGCCGVRLLDFALPLPVVLGTARSRYNSPSKSTS